MYILYSSMHLFLGFQFPSPPVIHWGAEEGSGRSKAITRALLNTPYPAPLYTTLKTGLLEAPNRRRRKKKLCFALYEGKTIMKC